MTGLAICWCVEGGMTCAACRDAKPQPQPQPQPQPVDYLSMTLVAGDGCPVPNCGGMLMKVLPDDYQGCSCHLGHPPCSSCCIQAVECTRCDLLIDYPPA